MTILFPGLLTLTTFQVLQGCRVDMHSLDMPQMLSGYPSTCVSTVYGEQMSGTKRKAVNDTDKLPMDSYKCNKGTGITSFEIESKLMAKLAPETCNINLAFTAFLLSMFLC